MLDAVLGWVAAESRRFRPGAAEPPLQLRVGRSTSRWWSLAVAPAAAFFT